MDVLRGTLIIALKDLRVELRSKEVINAALSFALVILLLFSFAFDPSAEETREIAGGLLWLVFIFAGILVLNRSFARETVNDCLDGLVASPLSGAPILLGKAVSNTVLLLVLELVTLPIFGIFYNVRWTVGLGWLLLVLLLGTWGLTVVGTLFSALTVNVSLREAMLPLLVFPITLPILMAAVQLTTTLFSGEPIAPDMIWLRVLIGCDIIFTVLAGALVESVLVG
ncbi:MAG TPA: heme exporter protein CcmB [Bryobacterales bacterium]|jgi:heme exporter protein B|nr:heme exporter protein CcmB [Bryobacterales bacterium]